MLAALDVDYRDDAARAACVRFDAWTSDATREEHVVELPPAAPYVPGSLYLRELPCLLAVLARLSVAPCILVVDGYATLGGAPGLGARLREALGADRTVVGIAKTRYAGAVDAVEITRGTSASPLFVTACGMPVDDAARVVTSMHGPFRVPTLLRRVDALARGHETALANGWNVR